MSGAGAGLTDHLPSSILVPLGPLEEALVRRCFSESADAVAVLDGEGLVRLWSAGAAVLFGRPVEGALGKPGSELFHVEAEGSSLLRAARMTGSLAGVPVLLRGRAGCLRANLEAERLTAPEGWLLRFHPASEGPAVPPPRALRFLARQAALGRMAAAFAHDVRTPIHVIGSTAESVAGEAGTLILRNARSAAARVEALMAFARLGALNLRPGSIDAVLKRALSLLDKECAKRSIRVKKELSEPSLVPLDPHHLQGVFHNLILNAMEAMPSGGTLTASSGGGRSPWASIQDTGHGIEPEFLGRILEAPFLTTKPSGTGLGLFLSRQILADHGARLTLRSKPGKGTEAKVHFGDK